MSTIRFRKKPDEFEAIRANPLNIEEIEEFVGGDAGHIPGRGLVVATLDGALHFNLGDWVVRNPHGKFFRCTHEVLNAEYERVEPR